MSRVARAPDALARLARLEEDIRLLRIRVPDGGEALGDTTPDQFFAYEREPPEVPEEQAGTWYRYLNWSWDDNGPWQCVYDTSFWKSGNRVFMRGLFTSVPTTMTGFRQHPIIVPNAAEAAVMLKGEPLPVLYRPASDVYASVPLSGTNVDEEFGLTWGTCKVGADGSIRLLNRTGAPFLPSELVQSVVVPDTLTWTTS